MVQCPQCARPAEPRLICSHCGSPLPVDLDCFAALGLARKLTIDNAALESSYHELGRHIHPDKFASAPANVRDASLKGTALLTRSYRTLRDPISRGLYWLELSGEKLGDNNKQVPPELAETVFEVQEQLADLRSAGGDAVSELRGEIESRRDELRAASDQLMRDLERNFAAWDESQSKNDQKLIKELKALLSRIAYMRTLIRDVDRGLESARVGGIAAE